MTVYEGYPVPLTPDTRPNRYLRVYANAHSKVSLQTWLWDLYGRRLRDLKRARSGRFRRSRSPIDVICSFSDYAVVGIDIFHSIEVSVTLEEVRALPTCVFGTDLLTVDTLHRETLRVHVSPASRPATWRLTLSSSFARNSTKAACTSLSDVRPMMLL